MSLIEGIGDEIVHFFGVLLILGIGIIAWCSTRISDLPQIRTILIVERRNQNDSNQQTSQTDRTVTGQLERNLCENHTSSDNLPLHSSDKNKVNTQPGEFNVAPEVQSTSENVLEEESSDARNVVDSNESANNQEEPVISGNSADNIRIRLKYLNDDQKLVEGRLQELLGDFKRRHFSVELSRQKRIRLIFNGQVLQSDDQTLQGYGLYDNCVVHCLIHTQQNVRPISQSQANASPPDWNLGVLLYACISFILGFAWFFRLNYSHLFTLTTTAALVSLTGMFAVSIIGMYISDEETVPS